MGENHFATYAMVIYPLNLLLCAVAYTLLTYALVAEHGGDSEFAKALGSDVKGKISVAGYVIAIPLAFVQPVLSLGFIAVVSLIWIVPDRRFARIAGPH